MAANPARWGTIEYQIHHIWNAIRSKQYKNALKEAMALPLVVILWCISLPFITYTIIISYGISVITTFSYPHVPWIGDFSSLLYHGYLCSKMESYLGSLRFFWALIIWVSISLMFSMIYIGTVKIVFLGACFSIQAVDAVIRRKRNRVERGFIKIRAELFPFVVMSVFHFMEVGSLPFHICGVMAGYAYAYGIFDMLQPGYVFWAKLESRLVNLEFMRPIVNSKNFFRCTGYEHTSDLLAHILVSDILQFHGQNIFRRAPIDDEIEDLEQKIETMVDRGYHTDDAAYILRCCAGDVVAALHIGSTLEEYYKIFWKKLMKTKYERHDHLFLFQYFTHMDADLCCHFNNRDYWKRIFLNIDYRDRFESFLGLLKEEAVSSNISSYIYDSEEVMNDEYRAWNNFLYYSEAWDNIYAYFLDR